MAHAIYATAMPLKTHLVEHSSMPTQILSAKTGAVGSVLVSDEQFDTHQSFVDSLGRVETAIVQAPNDTHMIVICTHGLEDTGTWLQMDDHLDDQRPEVLPHNLLPNARGSVLVYMAVCWGGYPGVVRRFQHGATPWPTVVGALAPLTPSEGNELQDEMIDVLKTHGLDEARLGATVDTFNMKYLAEYGHPTARIATASGAMRPPQSTAGIAWYLLRDEYDLPIDGPFEITQLTPTRANVKVVVNVTMPTRRLQLAGTIMPIGRLQLAKGAGLAVGDRFRFKAKCSPCGKYLQAVGDVTRA